MEPNDVLVLYSDGIIEAANSAGEEFGENRVLMIVREQSEDTAEEIRNHILAAADAFTGQSEPEDDRTLVVIVYSGAAQSGAAQVAGRITVSAA